MNWSVFELFTKNEIERDLLGSVLMDAGCEGMEESNSSIKIWCKENTFKLVDVKEILHDYNLSHIQAEHSVIPEENWNATWESNFEPILIQNRVYIRAPFHAKSSHEIELEIEPKMSFGTGHHPTTALMIEQMLGLDFKQKNVLDFGSGTGILSILGSKLGAQKVLAIDHEKWAYENCVENCERNAVGNVTSILGDDSLVLDAQYEIVLANINRNVILKNLANWKSYMTPKTPILLSGILVTDEQDILKEAHALSLNLVSRGHQDGWLCLVFEKK